MPKQWQSIFRDEGYTQVGRRADRLPLPYGKGTRADAIPPSGGPEGSDAAFTVQQLIDPYDIAAALLLPLQPTVVSTWSNADQAAVYTRAMNDYFLEHWVGLDPRFKLAIVVSPLDPEESAKEIRRYSSDRGVAGVWLPPQDIGIGARHYYPILEAAAETGLPIVFHPTGAEGHIQGSPRFATGYPNQYPEWKSVLPQVAQSNLANAVFEGVFERYPELKLVFIEFGFSWVGPMLWRMDQQWREIRFSVPWLKRRPSEYVINSVRFTTQPMDSVDKRDQLWAAMDIMHAERTLMFASDYPHMDQDNPVRAMANLPGRLKGRIGYENALETFGDRLSISPPSTQTAAG